MKVAESLNSESFPDNLLPLKTVYINAKGFCVLRRGILRGVTLYGVCEASVRATGF